MERDPPHALLIGLMCSDTLAWSAPSNSTWSHSFVLHTLSIWIKSKESNETHFKSNHSSLDNALLKNFPMQKIQTVAFCFKKKAGFTVHFLPLIII